MSFSFGAPAKNATGFTLPTATTAATPSSGQFSFGASGGGGDLGGAQSKPLGLFGAPLSGTTAPTATLAPTFGIGGTSTTTTTASAPSFGFGPQAASSAPQFGLGSALSTTTYAAPASTVGFGFVKPTTTVASTGFAPGTSTASLGAARVATSAAPLPGSYFGLMGAAGAAATSRTGPTSVGGFGINTTATTSALPATGTLTFAQLEDAINKWTVDLEEQGKVFANQAKHLNAWDRLLMSNGEKILSVSNGVERIKQQQQQLDQELDFVLAQQKELEDCIVPLEKEYEDVPVSDVDRYQTYKLAENIDAQLKQMSEDLKEIIEHLNESNKSQELSDPVAQIGRILNAHMSSLQWIDRNTSQISSHLDEITKMHDFNRRNHDNIHGA